MKSNDFFARVFTDPIGPVEGPMKLRLMLGQKIVQKIKSVFGNEG